MRLPRSLGPLGLLQTRNNNASLFFSGSPKANHSPSVLAHTRVKGEHPHKKTAEISMHLAKSLRDEQIKHLAI